MPLENFFTPGAVWLRTLQNENGIEPSLSLEAESFLGQKGLAKQTCLEHEGHWVRTAYPGSSCCGK